MKNTKIKNNTIIKRNIMKFNKIYYISISLAFLLILLFFVIANIINNDKEFSEIENRNLQEKPKILSENYVEKLNSYMADQFFIREKLISFKSRIDLVLGKNKINNVYIGSDNQLFEEFKITSNDDLCNKVDVINEFKKANEDLLVNFMLVPTATSILDDKLPLYAPVDDEIEYINNVKSYLLDDIKFIPIYDKLKANKNEYIYYKTDHHWTTDGAYLGYEAFCESTGIEATNKEDFEKIIGSNDFYGSLSSKVGLFGLYKDKLNIYIPKNSNMLVNYVMEQKKDTSLFNSDKLKHKDKYQVFLNGNHPLIEIETDKNLDKKILVIKDSFANNFVPFLTENYGNIFLIDLRYYTESINEFIKNNDINEVLFLYNVNTFNEDDSIFNLST
ncbi:MAG: DHHW family protein [Clostridium sp.]|uniref:DHHW family protein n=1 Tax=Clostridium sp. TaxID=1506 RepID=UPI0025CC2AD5|nr:DHHW family protein [Clostridium sp.]MCI6693336.1 DHHW family protein [Clostridium sp.]MDY4252596.1 DHHW family protein [Clostridium sp.]